MTNPKLSFGFSPGNIPSPTQILFFRQVLEFKTYLFSTLGGGLKRTGRRWNTSSKQILMVNVHRGGVNNRASEVPNDRCEIDKIQPSAHYSSLVVPNTRASSSL